MLNLCFYYNSFVFLGFCKSFKQQYMLAFSQRCFNGSFVTYSHYYNNYYINYNYYYVCQ